jgi:hypothetical protein
LEEVIIQLHLTADNDFRDFRDYIGQKSWEYLDHQGYDMQQYTTMFSEMWVQEFAKKGGGHHSAHVHWNQHVSGFYFLKASDKTSYPVFHEPSTGARATKLKMKDQKGVWGGSELIHFKPTTWNVNYLSRFFGARVCSRFW